MSLSEEERIRKLEKEIEEVQNLKTTMFNELEVRARKWAEVDKVKQRFEDMFAGFENKLVKIEAKMEEVREKSKASERIEKKPRESGKSKASGRIEKKPKEKPKKTQNKLMYVDLTQTQEEFYYLDFT
jgi:chromosome segregation ATPase